VWKEKFGNAFHFLMSVFRLLLLLLVLLNNLAWITVSLYRYQLNNLACVTLSLCRYQLNNHVITAQQLARSIRTSVGGSSGALYDIMVTAAARTLQVCEPQAPYKEAFKLP
jgi:hypothetical protein